MDKGKVGYLHGITHYAHREKHISIISSYKQRGDSMDRKCTPHHA